MKRKRITIAFTLLLIAGFILGATPNVLSQSAFGNKIYSQPAKDPGLNNAIQDLAFWMTKAYGKQFTVQNGSNREAVSGDGIYLKDLQSVNDRSLLQQLNKDDQSFHLRVSGNTAVITGSGTNSLINGIYTFLHELGFRWYMPGDAWTIMPSSAKARPSIDKVYTPSFQNRSYFAPGGTIGIPGVDLSNSFEKDFLLWNRRNRWSMDYIVKGHAGDAFYKARKAELDKHPEYFCNNKINKSGRIDISKPAVVNIFTEWALSQLNNNAGRFPVIGVDPEDGSGQADDCLPSTMKDVKTWSDKYFWLANKVGERLPASSPAIVQLFAYSKYAAPPGFALNKYVYPIIIPYSYQDYAEPETMIRMWEQKMEGRPMGMYDYWNSTLSGKGLPKFNIYDIPAKLKLWKKSNISTVYLESTYAKGPMGHVLWLASEMLWDLNTPFEIIYNEFLQNCFGPAAPDIKRMYDRWSVNFQEGLDVAKSISDLKAAESKTKNPAILKRITELKAYVNYIKLYYQYTYSKSAGDYETLINYLHGIHNLRLLHTSALERGYIEKPKNYQVVKSAGSTTTPVNASLSTAQIETMFAANNKNQGADYTVSSFKFDVSKARLAESGASRYQPRYIDGSVKYQFYNPVSQDLVFEAGASVVTPFLIKSGDKEVFKASIAASQSDYQTLKVKLAPGEYTLLFGGDYRSCRLKFPDKIVFFGSSNNYNNYQYPKQYIFVPGDVSEIVYRDSYGPGFGGKGFWVDPDGKKVQATKMGQIYYRVPVSPQQRNKVWTFEVTHGSYKMLNIPHLFSVNKFTYTGN